MKMIAAIHAGWKGAFKGIIAKVIKFMIKKGCKLEKITAVILSNLHPFLIMNLITLAIMPLNAPFHPA